MTSIKKICLITQDFYPIKGGIASYLLEVYKKYFSKVSFEVIVPESLGTKKQFEFLPFKVHRTPFALFNIDDFERKRCNKKILSILESIKPDLLLFGYIRAHPEAGVMYKKLHPFSKIATFAHAKEIFIDNCILKKTVVNGSHKGYSVKEGKFYKNVLNSMDLILSVSRFTKKILKQQGINTKIIILNPPVQNMKKINIKSSRKKLKIPLNSLVLLSVGRLIKRKGQDKIIKILPELKKKYSNIMYIIVGDGPELINLLKLAKDMNVQDRVKIFSSVGEEKNYFYSACDLFVLPCNFIPPNDVEGRCIVFLEANSFGKACVGGNSGGVPEAIRNNVTGLLINPDSKRDLLKKIIYLLDHPKLRKKFGNAGKKRVLKEFNIHKSGYLIKLFQKD